MQLCDFSSPFTSFFFRNLMSIKKQNSSDSYSTFKRTQCSFQIAIQTSNTKLKIKDCMYRIITYGIYYSFYIIIAIKAHFVKGTDSC